MTLFTPEYALNCWFAVADSWDDSEFQMPKLKGTDIERHFLEISREYVDPYLRLAESFTTNKTHYPMLPNYWCDDKSGWVRYSEDGSAISVDAPLEDCFAFDVEVCVLEGHHPVIATALSKQAWYSWISPHLLNKTQPLTGCLTPMDLLKGERLICLSCIKRKC